MTNFKNDFPCTLRIQHKRGDKQQEQCEGIVVVRQSEGVKEKEKCGYLQGKLFICYCFFTCRCLQC